MQGNGNRNPFSISYPRQPTVIETPPPGGMFASGGAGGGHEQHGASLWHQQLQPSFGAFVSPQTGLYGQGAPTMQQHLFPTSGAAWGMGSGMGAAGGTPAFNAQPQTPVDPCLDKYTSTKLIGGTRVITQDELLATITAPGAGSMEVTQLFAFWRPATTNPSRKSTVLKLDEKQLDIMYAVSGCADVMFLVSNVNQEVRKALLDIYHIDKANFSTWFKNRGRNPSKGNTAALSLANKRVTEMPHVLAPASTFNPNPKRSNMHAMRGGVVVSSDQQQQQPIMHHYRHQQPMMQHQHQQHPQSQQQQQPQTLTYAQLLGMTGQQRMMVGQQQQQQQQLLLQQQQQQQQQQQVYDGGQQATRLGPAAGVVQQIVTSQQHRQLPQQQFVPGGPHEQQHQQFMPGGPHEQQQQQEQQQGGYWEQQQQQQQGMLGGPTGVAGPQMRQSSFPGEDGQFQRLGSAGMEPLPTAAAAEQQPYATAEQQYATAEQRYATSEQRYVTSEQQYTTTQQQYGTAEQRYATTEQQYTTTQQQYATAERQHYAPQQHRAQPYGAASQMPPALDTSLPSRLDSWARPSSVSPSDSGGSLQQLRGQQQVATAAAAAAVEAPQQQVALQPTPPLRSASSSVHEDYFSAWREQAALVSTSSVLPLMAAAQQQQPGQADAQRGGGGDVLLLAAEFSGNALQLEPNVLDNVFHGSTQLSYMEEQAAMYEAQQGMSEEGASVGQQQQQQQRSAGEASVQGGMAAAASPPAAPDGDEVQQQQVPQQQQPRQDQQQLQQLEEAVGVAGWNRHSDIDTQLSEQLQQGLSLNTIHQLLEVPSAYGGAANRPLA